MTPRLLATLKMGCHSDPHTVKFNSKSRAYSTRRIFVLSSLNWRLLWTTQVFTSEIQGLMVHVKMNASGELVQSSIPSANMWCDRVGTNYIKNNNEWMFYMAVNHAEITQTVQSLNCVADIVTKANADRHALPTAIVHIHGHWFQTLILCLPWMWMYCLGSLKSGVYSLQ